MFGMAKSMSTVVNQNSEKISFPHTLGYKVYIMRLYIDNEDVSLRSYDIVI